MIRPISIFFRILTIGCLVTTLLQADHNIIIQLRHLPAEELSLVEDDYFKSLSIKKVEALGEKRPSWVSRKQLKRQLQSYLTPRLSDIAATYSGYRDISSPDGTIIFPLRQATPKLYIAITRTINFVPAKGNSIARREFISTKASDIVIYECVKEKDAQHQLFWRVKQVPVPENKIVNSLTIVLLSKPENIVMFEGDFMTEASGHFVMPPLYVINNSEQEEILLRNLNGNNYLEPIIADQKRIGDVSVQIHISNI